MTDIVNQHVERYLEKHPEYRAQVQRQGEGHYIIDGRQVKVGFCRQGFLVVHDGPLRQPLSDYLAKKETNAVYHQQGMKTSTLNQQPKEMRMSFGDEGNRYSRLDAMKVAKEQALYREKAAKSVSEGVYNPAELKAKYEKSIDVKLGTRRWRGSKADPAAAAMAAPAWWASATGQGQAQQQQQQKASSDAPPPLAPAPAAAPAQAARIGAVYPPVAVHGGVAMQAAGYPVASLKAIAAPRGFAQYPAVRGPLLGA